MSASKGSRAKSFESWRTQASNQGTIQIKPQAVQTRLPKTSSVVALKSSSGFRIGGYIRLSPSDEIREEGSLVSHPQRIEDYIKAKCAQDPNWGSIVEWYVDPDNSAKDMKRPAFIQMCRDIKAGKINAVAAVALERLSRNTKEFLQFWDFLKERRVKLIVLKQNFDTSTPAGEMMLIQMSAFAQFERESIVARIKDGARARAERGLSNGGPKRLGYDPDPAHPCRVVVNEREKPIAQMIFKKFLELGSIAAVQHYLNANNLKTKTVVSKDGKTRGGNRWTTGTLHGLLTDLSYIGKREINKQNRNQDQESLNPEERYKIVDAHWPAIISEKTFSDAQNLLLNNKGDARPHVHRYRLRQLVWCGFCSSPLVGQTSTGKGGRYFYYGHMRKQLVKGNRHLERCPIESISAPVLEEAIINRLIELRSDTDLVKCLAKAALEKKKQHAGQSAALLKSYEDQLRANYAKIDGYMSSIACAPSEETKRLTYTRIDALITENRSLETLIKEQRARKAESVIDLNPVLDLLRHFTKSFVNRPAHEQRDLLQDAVARVTITGPGTANVDYYKSPREEELFPGLSNPMFSEALSVPTHLRSGVRTALRVVGSAKRSRVPLNTSC